MFCLPKAMKIKKAPVQEKKAVDDATIKYVESLWKVIEVQDTLIVKNDQGICRFEDTIEDVTARVQTAMKEKQYILEQLNKLNGFPMKTERKEGPNNDGQDVAEISEDSEKMRVTAPGSD